ncbi:MAG: UDP-N-acetylmuramate dehydrogenase [Mogibacterium sp.]|nr:UDP-N-acetylmuramate dehydrogenase [Mogibacterium sp.]
MQDKTAKAIEMISRTMPEVRVLRDEPMSRHTSFRIGGPAEALVLAADEAELSAVLSAVTPTGAEHMIIGNGSNLLVSDEGYPGIMIKLAGDFESITRSAEDPNRVRVGAAVLMSRTAAFLTENGLSGFEFASGIPGSIGGAVFMNAGAYGGEIKDVVRSVRVMAPDGSNAREISGEDMAFSYRHSRAQDEDMLILSAEMELTEDDPAAVAERVADLAARRNAKQPVSYPSAGSTFKRPVGGYAAALIEQSGLKGYKVGGAEVSEKHSGFVINTGGATCEDVLAVMRHVREKVYADSGIMLEPEVRLINCTL